MNCMASARMCGKSLLPPASECVCLLRFRTVVDVLDVLDVLDAPVLVGCAGCELAQCAVRMSSPCCLLMVAGVVDFRFGLGMISLAMCTMTTSTTLTSMLSSTVRILGNDVRRRRCRRQCGGWRVGLCRHRCQRVWCCGGGGGGDDVRGASRGVTRCLSKTSPGKIMIYRNG